MAYTEYDPRLTWYSPETQRTVNNLPAFSKIRRQRQTVGQSIVNNGFGMHFQRLSEQIDQSLNDSFLSLASFNQPDLVYSVDGDPRADLLLPVPSKNLLRNSSFEIWTNHMRLPDWWYPTVSATGSMPDLENISVVDNGIIGNRCIQFTSVADGIITITQWIPKFPTPSVLNSDIYNHPADPVNPDAVFPFVQGQRLTLSMYYQIGDHTAADDEFYLDMRVYCYLADGSKLQLSKVLRTQTAGWERVEMPFILSKDCRTIAVSIMTWRSSGYAEDITVKVDALQLELGDKATDWRPFLNEKPFYLDRIQTYTPAPIVSEYFTRSQYTQNIGDFWSVVPTRVAVSLTRELATTPSAGVAGYGYEIDFWKDTWEVQWELGEDSGIDYIYKMGRVSRDQFGKYLIALSQYNGRLGTGSKTSGSGPEWDHTVEMHAITYFNGLLWVVGGCFPWYQYDGSGDRSLCLIVVDPKAAWPEADYLEALAVYKLTGVSGTPVRVEFKVQDPQFIYISTSDTEYKIRLYYDYYMIDEDTNTLHFREKYNAVGLFTMVDPRREIAQTVRRK